MLVSFKKRSKENPAIGKAAVQDGGAVVGRTAVSRTTVGLQDPNRAHPSKVSSAKQSAREKTVFDCRQGLPS